MNISPKHNLTTSLHEGSILPGSFWFCNFLHTLLVQVSSKYVKFDLIWLKNNFEIDIFFTNMLAGKHRACFSVIDDTRQSQHFRMTSRLKEFHIFSYVTNSLINYSSLFEVLQK